LHGGSVHASSSGLGKGAMFTLYLPLVEVRNPVREPTRLLSATALPVCNSESQCLSNIRVLVVDDEADNREMMTTVLQQYGAEVMAVASVKEALKAVIQQPPDILVSDIGMPEEDGYTLIRQLRQQEAANQKPLPAVALTAYARESEQQLALAAGFQMHIAKPMEPNNLVEAIAKLVNRTKKGYKRPKTLT
jgi:CheY-like chemotaxis protein